MRFVAIIPVLLCTAALVLSFLALFAGYSKGFMENYAVVTLNASRIGQNYFNKTDTHTSNPIVNIIHNITDGIENGIENGVTSFAHKFGLHDFYSWHVLNFCEGYYTPTAVPNATIPRSQIHQNITGCANRSALYSLRPGELLQTELTESGHGNINVSQLGLPSDLDDGLAPVRLASKAMYILYILSIVLVFLSIIVATICIFVDTRVISLINFVVDSLAFIALLAASSVAVAVGMKGADTMNKELNHIGISAQRGTRFLALTWAATGCLMVCKFVWCIDGVVKYRRARQAKKRARLEKETGDTFATIDVQPTK